MKQGMKDNAKEKKFMSRNEQVIVAMAELLLKENLITVTEKSRIIQIIKEGKV